MTDAVARFETEMLAVAELILRQWAGKFQRVGATWVGPILTRGGAGEHYESEVEVSFKDASGTFDVVSFFVYRAGKPVASRVDVEEWLQDDLADVIARRLSEAADKRRKHPQ